MVERKTPTLKCTRTGDRFKVSNENAKLDYSISLITADEVSMAGGSFGKTNKNYYLYNNQYTWTLSPSDFYSNRSAVCIWYIDMSGNLNDGNSSSSMFGIRPVINLKQDIEIISGDGTSISPYVIQNN